MKTRRLLTTMLCSLMLGLSFTGCSNSEDPEPTPPMLPYPMALILNEGLWKANNANISQVFFKHQTHDIKEFTSDIYQKTNGKRMGDVANAMITEDENIYVLLNGSKYVARLDISTKEQARYTFTKDEGEPRCMDVEDDYAYVTQYGGTISKIDIKDMTLVDMFEGGDNLEGIVEKDGKLYVANSYKGIDDFNQEVFVIDANSMTIADTIHVAVNPTKLYEIDDKIYVISQGDYKNIPAVLQVIDTTTGQSKKIAGTENISKIAKGNNKMIYGVCSAYDSDWQQNSFFIYNPQTDEISKESFLMNAPNSFKTEAIYLLEVDEESGFIYVGTSDYTTNGTIYQFDKNGNFLQSFDSGGINPSTMVFID